MTRIATIPTRSAAPPRHFGPMKLALSAMIMELSQLYLAEHGVADYPTATPAPEDHEAVRDHLLALAAIYGRHLRAVGIEVAANVGHALDRTCFEEATFVDALRDGVAHELDCAAERVREEDAEQAALSRHGSAGLVSLWSALNAGRMK